MLTSLGPPSPAPPPLQGGGRMTALLDRFMTYFVKGGGMLTIAVVFGIFFFILWQIFPLFRGASVEEVRTVSLPADDYVLLGADEWTELPFAVTKQGVFVFVDMAKSGAVETATPDFGAELNISAFYYDMQHQAVVLGTNDGRLARVKVDYQADFGQGARTVRHALVAGPLLPLGKPGHPLRTIVYGDSGAGALAAGLQDVDGKTEVHALLLRQRRSMMGQSELAAGGSFDLSGDVGGKPVLIAANNRADALVVADALGYVYYFFAANNAITLRQRFRPFAASADPRISGMAFIFGGVSLALTGAGGESVVYSLYHHPGEAQRTFGRTKQFDALPGGATFFAPSVRNKAFLVAADNFVSLRHSTTETVRWETTVPFTPRLGIVGGKYESLLLLDDASRLHLYALRDPHPEAGFKPLFRPVWYEGYPGKSYQWQSSGATDDFEPKLSLIPLIVGTLKGTLYAMLFAVPIALLAAVYSSEFMHLRFRYTVKPVMEIMASLPSVVLGFLAALYLAPLIETRVPSVLLMFVAIPLAAFMVGVVWMALPRQLRGWSRPGYEFLLMAPLIVCVGWLAWHAGPHLERWLCVVGEDGTADFRYWWPAVTGATFEQRNSLVVGFMMGFAVIPIIFTIADDAMYNVPSTLRAGSLALGANRWQTALKVVLPTASPGIFSGIMIGLGRAVGETMIVVMATGNTPIMEWNIFSGMRTLSANIAVELPEAPYQSTLYRTLYLGAMVLFLLTFAVNTLAELLRQHLREKYRTVE